MKWWVVLAKILGTLVLALEIIWRTRMVGRPRRVLTLEDAVVGAVVNMLFIWWIWS